MRTSKILAKQLHAGDYLVERSKGRRVGRHICELHIDRRIVKAKVNVKYGTEWREFKRTQKVWVMK